jgi:hypothetical protein
MKWLEEYKKDLAIFDQTIELSLIVSNLIGDIPTTEKIHYAHKLYSRLLLTSLSVIRLCPFSRLSLEGEIWDFFSIANLVRCSMENYAVFHYLGVEQIDQQEEAFRIKLLYYHKDCELYKYYKDLNTPADVLNKLGFTEGLPKRKAALKEHPFFEKITNKRKQDDILNGNSSITKKHTDILNELQLKKIPFKAFYRFYSNQTHSAPLGYFTSNNERGRGERNETEVVYITWAIDIARTLLVTATHHVINLIPESKTKVPANIISYFETEYNKFIS